ncbi:Zn(II)2Cys6 transcription factor domain-containing protein [Aspergillus luchuensis]|uniref:Zn(2)-C6 fungal-type domain-containing protein n=1 Tax=Aspergillus kawachii TaxID=1069201 RepID=A0A7R7W2D7_ASPKA|nr:uncharacterized protein AKAW2_20082S [Aspergillus luchuensis]BCR95142.1 hypothetical protein AKAW2_20082S [Aspergillus luchuensis]GAA89694.1 hypothetical protein AKAW_07808 [Aspergillus luchuensis IFO 4308]
MVPVVLESERDCSDLPSLFDKNECGGLFPAPAATVWIYQVAEGLHYMSVSEKPSVYLLFWVSLLNPSSGGHGRIRRVKCDERKPACLRCTSTNRKCDGYMSMPYSIRIAKQLAQVTAFVSPAESRALEFFFRKSAAHLAGYFTASFWTRTVLQLSLTEPTIRQAIAAIGFLYEAEGMSTTPAMAHRWQSSKPDLALHLYNRAIRTTIDKVSSGIDAVPLVIATSILFASLEFLRGNATGVTSHITSGLNLVRSWRAHRERSCCAKSSQTHWVDAELAPILNFFSLNTYEMSALKHLVSAPQEKVHVNPVDAQGKLLLNWRFRTFHQARIALLDLMLYCIGEFPSRQELARLTNLPHSPVQQWAETFEHAAQRWVASFELLVQRKQSECGPAIKNEIDATRMLWYCYRLGLDRYRVANESGWDDFRAVYEDIVSIAERLLSDSDHYPDDVSKTISLDVQLLYPLQAVAWKCRWPDLRRRALGLLQRIPKQELIFYTPNYHAVCTRIMELEEGAIYKEMLPPDHARIYTFVISPTPATTADHPVYSITFTTFPQGRSSEPHFHTESLWLHPSQAGVTTTVPPVDMMKHRDWPPVARTDAHLQHGSV